MFDDKDQRVGCRACKVVFRDRSTQSLALMPCPVCDLQSRGRVAITGHPFHDGAGCAASNRMEPAHHPAFSIAPDGHTGVTSPSPPSPRRPPRI